MNIKITLPFFIMIIISINLSYATSPCRGGPTSTRLIYFEPGLYLSRPLTLSLSAGAGIDFGGGNCYYQAIGPEIELGISGVKGSISYLEGGDFVKFKFSASYMNIWYPVLLERKGNYIGTEVTFELFYVNLRAGIFREIQNKKEYYASYGVGWNFMVK